MRNRVWTLRMAALLAAASFAVHQLRFVLAYGSSSSSELAHQGHAYLSALAPLVVGALMVAVAQFAGALARGRRDGRAPSFRGLSLISSASLIGVYCAQELCEGMLASGHPGGLAGIFGAGGWLAVPLAVAAGLAVALMMRGAEHAVELVAAPARLRRPRAGVTVSTRAPTAAPQPAGVLARQAAARAPPVASV